MAPPATVLMVAEKPSLAQSIAQFLSNGSCYSRRGALDVHEWQGSFRGAPANFRMTSVIGHVYSIDFPAAYNDWGKTDPLTLFDAVTVKQEANPKARVCSHLQAEGRGVHYLVLWLDCDREGENICFEVMEDVVPVMARGAGGGGYSGAAAAGVPPNVLRARFSAITAPEIKAAMGSLGVPNANEALAVDARQELDLKVGVAFTRFQTRFFQGKYGNLDAGVVSYGPCQTPTLNFCVERHQQITSFQPESFWVVRPTLVRGGQVLELEWARGRVFDQDVGTMYCALVKEAKKIKVVDVVEKEERRPRPHGLNTVEMLKVASSQLGMGPAHCMAIAERLYIQGYLSYPRTESSAYPPNFDLDGTVRTQTRHPLWGQYAQGLLAAASSAGGGIVRPKGGVDVGDHPPITPMRPATEEELGGGDTWRLYEYVARHFLASVSPDCVYRRTTASFAAGGEEFSAAGSQALRPGWTSIMGWRAVEGSPLPSFTPGEALDMKDVVLHQGKTSPPDYLTEAELIGLMEKHGIGTDASIPTHIENVCTRNYVSIQAGRKVVPTELGITLIRGYQLIDPELCRPQVRAHVEKQLDLVAKGSADKGAVVAHALAQFKAKFEFFVSKIGRMDALFEASFSSLADSGKPLSKCGKCRRYMKYIASRPSRLYCPTCEEVHSLPQGGDIKLYKGLACPLDDYELLLFSLAGKDGKTYPLCPLCYNSPPFEGAHRVESGLGAGKGGMPCATCPHPTCQHAPARTGVVPCPSCTGGTLVLDPVSAPKWRLDCNRCAVLIYLPKDLHSARVSRSDTCDECSCRLLELDWRKGSSPLEGGETQYSGCVACDDFLRGLCEVKTGSTWVRRGGGGSSGRGRGRGRGRHGRGRGGPRGDPKMSFRDF